MAIAGRGSTDHRRALRVAGLSEIDVREVAGRVVCDQAVASCRCRESAGHAPDIPHRCPCGGSWNGEDGAENFEIVSLPPGIPLPGLGRSDVW